MVCVGCNSGGETNETDAADPSAGSTGGPPPACEDVLCLQAPEQGFQVRSVGATIDSGQDVEYCEVVELPGDPSEIYYVNRFESEMTVGSHHLIVAAIVPGSPTEENAAPGDRIPCFQTTAFGEDLDPVTGSQAPYHEESYPEGIGRTYRGGQRLVFDYHYFNTTSGPLEARAAVNFHTVDASRVQKIARSFGFYNFAISTPPGQEASFTTECAFSSDIMVHKLTRHTHKWGTDFTVWYRGGAHDGEEIFRSANYEDVDHVFLEPVLMQSGEGFRFECTYKNTEAHTLEFGVKATDEMCILFGTWWEAGETAAPSQSCTNF
jgi:hypothetical protein